MNHKQILNFGYTYSSSASKKVLHCSSVWNQCRCCMPDLHALCLFCYWQTLGPVGFCRGRMHMVGLARCLEADQVQGWCSFLCGCSEEVLGRDEGPKVSILYTPGIQCPAVLSHHSPWGWVGYARASGSQGRLQQWHVKDTNGPWGTAAHPEISMFTLLEGRGMYCFTVPK